MAANWFRRLHDIWPFPDSYVTLDVETSGLSPTRNVLCTFGAAHVRNRVLQGTQLVVLNWFDHPQTDRIEFSRELQQVEAAMRAKGKPFHHNRDYLREHGIDPIVGLQQIFAILQQAETDGLPLVSFNGYSFDAEFLQAHIHDFLGTPWMIGDNSMWDLGMAEKACQLEPTDDPLPMPSESIRAWAFRIGRLRRKGVFWSLDSYCESKYGICRKANIDPAMQHRSDMDALCLHYLFEAQRALALA